MSYILDALRKSEQQRQATQPDTVTDRILISQPQLQPKRKLWLITLLISNLLIITGMLWYFNRQSAPVAQQANNNIPQPTAKAVAELVEQNNAQHYAASAPSMVNPAQTTTRSTSIAQLIESQKVVETPKPAKKPVEKKPQANKKEYVTKVSTPSPRIAHGQIPEESGNEPSSRTIAKPKTYGTPDLNELPYEVRNNLPNLNVNVFSYAQQPQDRFVIIDMVKYKTGQLVKGQVKLKEIRPDSIVLENNDGSTFKVERP